MLVMMFGILGLVAGTCFAEETDVASAITKTEKEKASSASPDNTLNKVKVSGLLRLVDQNGKDATTAQLPREVMRSLSDEASKLYPGQVLVLARIVLPDQEKNDYIKVDIVKDRGHYPVPKRDGDDYRIGKAWIDEGNQSSFEAMKIRYIPIKIDLPSKVEAGTVIYLGDIAMTKCSSKEETVLKGQVVDQKGKPLTVYGTMSLYLQGTHGESEHFETAISKGCFNLGGVTPEEYYIQIHVKGYNSYNQCINIGKKPTKTDVKITAYPCMELTLRKPGVENSSTFSVQLGELDEETNPVPLSEKTDLVVSQYGNAAFFQTSNGKIRIGTCPGPYADTKTLISRIDKNKKPWQKCSVPFKDGTLILLLDDNDTILSVLEMVKAVPMR